MATSDKFFSSPLRLLIIDDHPLVRDGITAMLKDHDNIVIAGACSTGNEALTFLTNNQPDLILLDISLPDMDGLALCEHIRKISREVRIIGLTSTNEASIITGLLQRGANGYLLKNMDRNELLTALRRVQDGKVYVSEAANEKLLQQLQGTGTGSAVPALTRREKEILQLLADGMKGPQIAEKLFLSPLTVETHRKNLLRKFNANSVQLLLKVARDHKLLSH